MTQSASHSIFGCIRCKGNLQSETPSCHHPAFAIPRGSIAEWIHIQFLSNNLLCLLEWVGVLWGQRIFTYIPDPLDGNSLSKPTSLVQSSARQKSNFPSTLTAGGPGPRINFESSKPSLTNVQLLPEVTGSLRRLFEASSSSEEQGYCIVLA